MENSVNLDELWFDPRFDRLRDDPVAIMVIEYYELLSAATGGDGEVASFVH